MLLGKSFETGRCAEDAEVRGLAARFLVPGFLVPCREDAVDWRWREGSGRGGAFRRAQDLRDLGAGDARGRCDAGDVDPLTARALARGDAEDGGGPEQHFEFPYAQAAVEHEGRERLEYRS